MTITSTNQLPLNICVLIDGGCLGNNRPNVEERAMYGSMAVFNKQHLVESTHEAQRALLHTLYIPDMDGRTNNIAELGCVIHAMLYIQDLRRRHGKPLGTITIISDSELAVGFGGGSRKPSNKSPDAIRNLHTAICNLTQMDQEVEFQHADNVWVKSVLGH